LLQHHKTQTPFRLPFVLFLSAGKILVLEAPLWHLRCCIYTWSRFNCTHAYLFANILGSMKQTFQLTIHILEWEHTVYPKRPPTTNTSSNMQKHICTFIVQASSLVIHLLMVIPFHNTNPYLNYSIILLLLNTLHFILTVIIHSW